jgi:hypothetical protein
VAEGREEPKASGVMGVSQPLRLVVDQAAHAQELRRFEGNLVRGPRAEDCAIWCSSIGADGYGRFWVRRAGTRIMVRANRYALAAAMNGKPLEPWVRALHGCDNPACVRVSLPGETGLLHIIGGSQRDNMLMMAGPAAAAGGCWCAAAITESRRAASGRWRYAKRCATVGTPKRRGGAAGLDRPDPVVGRTATTQSEHGDPWQRG